MIAPTLLLDIKMSGLTQYQMLKVTLTDLGIRFKIQEIKSAMTAGKEIRKEGGRYVKELTIHNDRGQTTAFYFEIDESFIKMDIY